MIVFQSLSLDGGSEIFKKISTPQLCLTFHRIQQRELGQVSEDACCRQSAAQRAIALSPKDDRHVSSIHQNAPEEEIKIGSMHSHLVAAIVAKEMAINFCKERKKVSKRVTVCMCL